MLKSGSGRHTVRRAGSLCVLHVWVQKIYNTVLILIRDLSWGWADVERDAPLSPQQWKPPLPHGMLCNYSMPTSIMRGIYLSRTCLNTQVTKSYYSVLSEAQVQCCPDIPYTHNVMHLTKALSRRFLIWRGYFSMHNRQDFVLKFSTEIIFIYHTCTCSCA